MEAEESAKPRRTSMKYLNNSRRIYDIWEGTDEEWTMVLRQKNSEDQWELFAEKKLQKMGQ